MTYFSKLRLLFPIVAFLFSAAAGITFAAWLDAPNAPPNYGVIGCTPPCEQEDFMPMNLSDTTQTKLAGATFTGDLISNRFIDTQNADVNYPDYFIDPASPSDAARFAGSVGIGVAAGTPSLSYDLEVVGNAGITGNIIANGNVGIGITNPQAPLTVMQTIAGLSTGLQFSGQHIPGITAGGVINSYDSNGTTARSLTLQTNSGNVGIGTATPGAKLEVAGDIYFPTGRTFYNTNWGGGNLIDCSAGVTDYLNPSSNPDCTCQTGTVIHSGNTCTFNSWAHGGNNWYDCVYSCTITSPAMPEYYSALKLWQQSGSPTGFYK